MSQTRNLAWLRKQVERWLKIDAGQPDQAFDGTSDDSYDQIDAAINEAYENALEDIRVQCDPTRVVEADTFTWPSGDLTFTLPEHLSYDAIWAVEDITNADPGEALYIMDRGMDYTPTLFWLTANKIQWGSAGAPSDKSLRIYNFPLANEMKEPSDTPTYVPPRYRRLLVWDALILLREVAEDQTIYPWAGRRQKIWDRMVIDMSEGRPFMGNKAQIFLNHFEGNYF